MEQLALSGVEAETRQKNVGIAVVVVVADRNAMRIDAGVEPGVDRDIGERAVAVVVVESHAAERASDHDVEVAIVVVVEHGDAAAATGLVEADFESDVIELNRGLFEA